MAEMRATPYSNPFLGGVSGLVDALTGWMQDPNRTQQMQSVGGFIQDSGIPKTLQRMAYGEPITNVNQANVPLLKPETGNAALTLLGALPVGAPAAKMLPKNVPVGMSIKPIGDVIPPMMPKAPVSPAGFYSAAEQAALNLQRNKGSGQAFINDLMKAPDVKKEELQYTGLLDAFSNKPQATKQELIDYLRVNRPDVKSRTLRDIEDVTYDQAESEYIRQTGFSPPEDMGIGEIWDSLPKEASAQYKSDSLQGGKNYREILLQLPQKDEYYSSHWDEPNVFAHVRLNDRLDSDGKKMTLIEEVQSDWHQAGREQGYRRPNKERIPTSFEQDRTGWSVFDQDGNEITYISNDVNPSGTKEGAINVTQQRLDSDQFIVRSKNVPEAPMKETWYQTALRKAVKDAIDQGSDRVGIVTGARNAERFGKGKRIDNIGITNFEGGFKEIEMQTPDGGSFYAVVDKDGVISEANSNLVHEFNGKKLEDMIGKSAAQKVLSSQENQFIPVSDVVVGGKGMKKYYDDVYPKYLDKFAKKYGSSVKEGSLGTDKPQSFATMLDNSEFKSEWALADKFRREEIIDILEGRSKKEPVRYIEITPEMRKAFGGNKGVPLFQAAPLIPAGTGAGGLLDQFGERQQ